MATHSSILAWRIPTDREAWQATVHGVTKSQTRLSTALVDEALARYSVTNDFPGSVLMPGESRGWGSLVRYSP